ncbi:YfaZ family protein [Halomonas sp. McH1-25]|uniref:YfaZ family outer membrane protein n=1 Tax=unclassified Halomonas TaxID=2609666 RepID=UPI001EF44173|nr:MULTISPECIES: YfaZ family outer membrane protein [unclassified Halomonas]MCG7599710.1 YfaZ family protein [Halomonas sp. McH1-25]MCP1342794.1 YfaZ family protein [Halomonas sp. FL8]MCP1360864.1 YfaZ family protein [Halomonas sp. BBD45]MCP1365779.1 YfaZ family protein [Halomonas sp. BBD48]
MKAVSLLAGVASLTLTVSLAQASGLDVNINNEAARFAASGELMPGIELGGSLLSSDDNGDLTAAGIQLMGTESTRNYEVGAGPRWSHYDSDQGDGGGLGLGGYGYVYLPAVPKLSVGGYGVYTPGALTYQDFDHGSEFGARARYRVAHNVQAYVGYRRVSAEFGNGDSETLDNGPLVGVHLNF